MKNIAPDIFRQRFLIEGFYEISVDKSVIRKYFSEICTQLKLRMYGKPIIFSPGGEGKKENQGYDAFVPLIDSGISVYVWTNKKFVSIILYTCKGFASEEAKEFTKKFFEIGELVSEEF